MTASSRLLRLPAIAFAALLAVMPLGLMVIYSFAWSWLWPAITPKAWDLHAWRYVLSPESGVGSSSTSKTSLELS